MTDKDPTTSIDRIDRSDSVQMNNWSKKLNATPQQLHEAIEAVGDKAADVEMHLKGTRSTTNAEEVQKSVQTKSEIS